MSKRFMVTVTVLVNERAGLTLKEMPAERRPAAIVHFLAEQSVADLREAVEVKRIVEWTREDAEEIEKLGDKE